jgi:hemerythrin-like domain-containing protein
MQATDILRSEHRVIELAIAALETAANRLQAGQALRAGFFVDAARFIRDFADGYHHGKEEGVLFEAMGRNGMPMDAGPIAVMVYEHERARELTARIGEAAARLAAGDRNAALSVVDCARAYGALLTQHIYKEDNILFPMAARWIPAPAQRAVLDEFEAVERTQAKRGSKASFVDLARALCEEMGIDADALPTRELEPTCHAR